MPYSNNEMTYDQRKHRYVLNQEYVLEDMNIDLDAVLNTSDVADIANAADNFLKRVADIVYSYIYRVTPFRYKTERELAINEKNRAFLCDAMREQVLYMLNNGDISALSGINIESGAVIERSQMRSNEVAPLAKDVLIDSGIVRAFIPDNEFEITPKYEEEHY